MRKLLATLGILAVLGWGAALFVDWPVPLVDRNRQPLAQTAAEGYCAGQVFVNTRGYGSTERMADCLGTTEKSTEKDLTVVQLEFCKALYDTVNYPQSECMSIMKERKYWPTLEGTITSAWDKHFPYPGGDALESGANNGSRTGDRDPNERTGDITR